VSTHYDAEHDFGPLKAYLERKPEEADMPWEYMGHDEDGAAHYRARETDTIGPRRICLTESGHYAAVHVVSRY